MSIGHKSLTNLRSEMIFLQGKPVFLYLPTTYTPILTDNPQILLTMETYVAAKGKVGHVTSSAFRSFSGFIIALRNIYEKFINRQTSGESASLSQYLGCNTVFVMRLRVTVLRRKTVSLQSNIAHRE